MFTSARMPLVSFLFIVIAASGCNKRPAPFEVEDRTPVADRDAEFDPPNLYPEWAYDSEHYMRPAEDLQPEPRVKRDDPLHYFTNERVVMIRQPSGYTPENTPRVAVWWTDNNGFHWQKAGYFGRQQTHFPFEAEDDGDYGVRFVGPGQPSAEQVSAYPERVYHIDTTPPEVEVWIEPEQSWYHVGQTITIAWRAEDYHLTEYPVCIGMLMDFSAERRELVELQRDLADEGSITYEIRSDALDHEVRFRVDALDRAGNLGIAVSHALQIVEESLVEDGGEEGVAVFHPEEAIEPASGQPELAISEDPAMEAEPQEAARQDVPFASQAERISNADDLLSWKGPFFESDRAGDNEERPQIAQEDWPEVDAEVLLHLPAEAQALTGITDTVDFTEDDELFGPPRPEPLPIAEEEASDSIEAEEPWPVSENTAEANEPLTAIDATEMHGSATCEGEDTEGESLNIGPLVVADITHGNGLVVPLPATIQSDLLPGTRVTAHPWRMLGSRHMSHLQMVWSLPLPRFSLELYQMFEGRFLADHPTLRPVAEPGGVDRTLARITRSSDEDGGS
ncbi:MAG: hypothetical protein ABII12_04470 [Planctomycetota bacterium]